MQATPAHTYTHVPALLRCRCTHYADLASCCTEHLPPLRKQPQQRARMLSSSTHVSHPTTTALKMAAGDSNTPCFDSCRKQNMEEDRGSSPVPTESASQHTMKSEESEVAGRYQGQQRKAPLGRDNEAASSRHQKRRLMAGKRRQEQAGTGGIIIKTGTVSSAGSCGNLVVPEQAEEACGRLAWWLDESQAPKSNV